MDGRELQEIWRSGRPSFGAWTLSSDPATAAVLANVGYEWILVDTEHCPFDAETLRAVLAAIRLRGAVPIVRVPANEEWLIKQALDRGGEGVLVPLLRNAEDARRAVRACRYPPDGVRGFSPYDVSNYYQDLQAYLRTINERVVVMLQVELREAVENLEEILAVPGISCLLIGPADLSFSLGHPLMTDHPEVQGAIERVIGGCRAAGMPVAVVVGGSAEDLAGWVRRGVNVLPVGDNLGWLISGAGEMLRAMRERTGGR
jgi:4-hydroxy-2-oxoheptanedioate aldolase